MGKIIKAKKRGGGNRIKSHWRIYTAVFAFCLCYGNYSVCQDKMTLTCVWNNCDIVLTTYDRLLKVNIREDLGECSTWLQGQARPWLGAGQALTGAGHHPCSTVPGLTSLNFQPSNWARPVVSVYWNKIFIPKFVMVISVSTLLRFFMHMYQM